MIHIFLGQAPQYTKIKDYLTRVQYFKSRMISWRKVRVRQHVCEDKDCTNEKNK